MAKKTAKKVPKLKIGAWFHKVRGSYLPGSWQGWLTYIPFTAFLIWTLMWAIDTETSVAKVLFMVFPMWIAAAVVMTWLAASKS